MMKGFLPRLAVLGVLLGTAFFDLAPAFAQAPPPVPALPDAERRTSYSLSASTCTACSVGFSLYGDSIDYGNWLEVWLITGSGTTTASTLLAAGSDYTISSPTGPLATIPRPITDATITLAAAKTGTLQIVGARRPRRTSQFAENRGVAARDLNQVLTDIIASNRETWDRTKDVSARALLTMPGDTIGQLPAASVRAGGVLGFDGSGNPIALAAGSSGTANVVGPNVSVIGHIATFGNATGTILLDGGLVGAGDFVGPAGAVVNHVVTFNSVTGKVGKDSGLTLTPSTGTITVTNAKTLAVDNSLEFAGTDSTVMTFPTTSATLARTDAANTFTGHQTIEGVTTTGATGTGPLVFANGPSLTALSITAINKVFITQPATSATLTIADGKILTDTSGIGASVLLGATGGGFAAYGGGSCTNQFIRSLSAAAAPTCASVANTDLSNSSITIGSTAVSLGGTAATVSGLTLTAPTINGGTHTALTALGIRSSGSGAFDLTLNNTENLTAGRTLTLTLNNAPRTISLSGNITTAADLITAGANSLTLTTTGTTNVTMPTTGTLAVQNAVNTFSSTNVFSAVQQFTDIKLSSGHIFPTADSTTALQVTKADGTTRIMDFDTSNARVGINKTPGAFDLDVNGAMNVGGILTVLTAAPGTNSTQAASTAFVQAAVVASTTGVSSLNGLTGGLSIAQSAVAQGAGTLVTAGGSSVTVAAFVEQMTPGGRLTVVSGGCNVTTDQVAQTTLYYAPCGGQWVPTYDGTNMALRQFTSSASDTVGLSIALGSNWAANTLYDGFVGLNSGAVTLCTGPAWTSSTAGSSSRGSGAGTTQLALFKGMWTNAVSMTCRFNNTTTFACGVNQCTYVGTFLSGTGTGTIDLKFGTAAAGGGLGLLSICNMYNRADTRAASSDTTASWPYTSSTWRAANAGSTKISIVSCQGDVGVSAKYFDLFAPTSTSAFQTISIGLNASNAVATRSTTCSWPFISTAVSGAGMPCQVSLDDIPPVGLSTLFAIEQADNTHATTFDGQTSPYNYMQLSASVRM